jgi:hypothetical protein
MAFGIPAFSSIHSTSNPFSSRNDFNHKVSNRVPCLVFVEDANLDFPVFIWWAPSGSNRRPRD